MKKQEVNKKMTETMRSNATMTKAEPTGKKTLTDWLIQTIGASAIAGISAMSGSSDGGEVYRNLQR